MDDEDENEDEDDYIHLGLNLGRLERLQSRQLCLEGQAQRLGIQWLLFRRFCQ